MQLSDSRRRLLTASGGAVTVALAGCLGLFAEDIEFDEEVPEDIADHLSGANNVDGSITDRTGETEVSIENGAGGSFAFGPALARIDAGTTVTWEWVADGHTVTSDQTPGDSEFDVSGDSGKVFTETFDKPGTVLYYCRPHRGAGHRGALIVE